MARGPHRRFFDLWSLVYDAPGVQRVTYRPVQDAVVRALRADPPTRVLDVGCGTGQLGQRLARELPRSRLVGCDLSRGMLRQAIARGPELAWVQGNAERLPFAEGSFDAVVSTEAFHWFADPERALGDFRRVLAERGRLLVAFVNPAFEVLSGASRVVSRCLGEPLRWPTAPAWRSQVERAGFEVLGQRRIFRLPAPLLFPPVLTEAVRRD